jgi:site-specific DNA-methyltransferase (adenine-specific)
MTVRILQGDCIEVMRTLAENSVDAVVTDPPYGIRFMGKAWDGADIEARVATRARSTTGSTGSMGSMGSMGAHKSPSVAAGVYDLSPAGMLAFQEFSAEWAREAIRVLKPGGHLLSFSSPRTYHRMVCGIEAAGLEIRDQILWLFGSGFPKSHNGEWGGTALKPAHEPIVVARKPLKGTVEENWRKWGTGALNIDGCRVGYGDMTLDEVRAEAGSPGTSRGKSTSRVYRERSVFYDGRKIEFNERGRWPANIIHDGSDEVLAAFPDAPGQASAVTGNEPTGNGFSGVVYGHGGKAQRPGMQPRKDTGSAARFFYCAKASKRDRDEGLDDMPLVTTDVLAGHRSRRMEEVKRLDGAPPSQGRNTHPTVKPTDLMRYLIRLVTPAGGTVLDCFMGSGSTLKAAVLEGFDAIGIEREAEHVATAQLRVDHAMRQAAEEAAAQADAAAAPVTLDLFAEVTA